MKDFTNEFKEDVCKVIHKIILAYGVEIENEKFEWIIEKFIIHIRLVNISENQLEKMYYEMIQNYKNYLPLCLASFCTALYKIKNK